MNTYYWLVKRSFKTTCCDEYISNNFFSFIKLVFLIYNVSVGTLRVKIFDRSICQETIAVH